MNLEFTAGGTLRSLEVTTLDTLQAPRAPLMAIRGKPQQVTFDHNKLLAMVLRGRTLRTQVSAANVGIAREKGPGPAAAAAPHVLTLVTPSIIVEGAHAADISAARNQGASVIEEGYDGKALLSVSTLAEVQPVMALLAARQVGAVAPNFLRLRPRPQLSAHEQQWAHAILGVPQAWQITRGDPEVRVAVLDEGVDTAHPLLKPAVLAEHDFIGGKGDSAMPDGNDAHGTACAGIIVSRAAPMGIAPGCSLLAARIAMDDGSGHWVFDDFATADAIDWSWRQGACVLSNSWGGGVPSDPISRAFGRARTQGRAGKGALVCIAAGNAEHAIGFPGDLPGYVTVGASNPAEERKTHASSDGEDWWGSNFGPTLWLLAPGVFIETADITGTAGYDPGDTTAKFNGTSAATPHVAAAAALMLSANPGLTASDVRQLLASTAHPLAGQAGWTEQLGHGRLDVAAAVQAARSFPARA